MKKLFYTGLAVLAIFEVLKVYFIMPMPGSQVFDSLEVAYRLHTWRWIIRILCGVMIAAGAPAAFRARRKWLVAIPAVLTAVVVWLFTGPAMADHMFQPPRQLILKPRAENKLPLSSVVVAVEHNGEAKAYPIRYLIYHHQVQDTIGGKSYLVTYCSVCRTGRVFEPLVNGRPEKFRLVGMDHYNAMFEDATTGSWWRQATGEAVAGPLKGTVLRDAMYTQLTLREWFALHPAGLVMQPDPAALDEEDYDVFGRYEHGKSRGDLTRTDPLSWQDKSWVIGVQVGTAAKAYDWNRLKQLRVINDEVGGKPIVLALADDGQGYVAFERPAPSREFTLAHDILSADGQAYDFSGRNLAAPADRLAPVRAHQEFWHSWRTFHPGTMRFR
ncbi:MAG TPA: DUF3179 domain-containing (seleno)protein [Lacunisphaera sp.]|nr:DUF3179 domain-containing (seleno)protein [Lacunisphaera sp.]